MIETLLDEGLPHSCGTLLKAAGRDAVQVHALGMSQATDADHVAGIRLRYGLFKRRIVETMQASSRVSNKAVDPCDYFR
jgi:hypothetical protein